MLNGVLVRVSAPRWRPAAIKLGINGGIATGEIVPRETRTTMGRGGDYLSFIHDWKAHWTIAVLRMPLCSYSREIRAMNREVYFGLSLFVLKSKVQHESIRRPEIDERACFHFSMKWTEKEIPNQRFLEKPRMKSFYAVSCMLFCAWRI